MQGSFDFARPISVSPEVAAHPIKLKHQVEAKGNQYEKEIVMVEHDWPPILFPGAVTEPLQDFQPLFPFQMILVLPQQLC
jgi:hypothetical protein